MNVSEIQQEAFPYLNKFLLTVGLIHFVNIIWICSLPLL